MSFEIAYKTLAESKRSNTPWLRLMQDEAIDKLVSQGFPTRKTELWKYTNIAPILAQDFELAKNEPQSVPHSEAPIGHKIYMQNGSLDLKALEGQLPDGVSVLSINDAINTKSAVLEDYLGRVLPDEHGFHWLNKALIDNGVLIHVAKDVKLNYPIVLSHWQDKANQASFVRNLVVLEEGASLSLVEDFHGSNDVIYYTNSVTELVVKAHAEVTHYKIERQGKDAYHFDHTAVQEHHQSSATLHSLSLGGKIVRSDASIYFEEEFGEAILNGIYIPHATQHIDNHTDIDHKVANCKSEQDYKGIIAGNARAVFNGKVIVRENAIHTEALQSNKNLLLSDKAEIDTKPELQIFADDVKCSHGATVGQLSEDELFYLATRGIARADATRFLIRAFALVNIQKMGSTSISNWMSKLLNNHLG